MIYNGKKVVTPKEIVDRKLIITVKKRSKVYWWIKQGILHPENLNPKKDGRPLYYCYLEEVERINNLLTKQGEKNGGSKKKNKSGS